MTYTRLDHLKHREQDTTLFFYASFNPSQPELTISGWQRNPEASGPDQMVRTLDTTEQFETYQDLESARDRQITALLRCGWEIR